MFFTLIVDGKPLNNDNDSSVTISFLWEYGAFIVKWYDKERKKWRQEVCQRFECMGKIK